MGIDFQEIRTNALKDGIPLHEIMVIYEGLSKEQIETLTKVGINLQDLGGGKAMGHMLDSRYDYLQPMATGVLKLSAD